MRYSVAAILLLASVLLESELSADLPGIGGRPDFALVTVFAWAVIRGPGEGALIGFVGGLLLDSALYTHFGLNAAFLGIAAYVAGLPEAGDYRGNLPFFLAVMAATTLVYHATVFLALQGTGQAVPPLALVLRTALPAAAMNALLLVPVLAFCRRVLRALEGARQLQL